MISDGMDFDSLMRLTETLAGMCPPDGPLPIEEWERELILADPLELLSRLEVQGKATVRQPDFDGVAALAYPTLHLPKGGQSPAVLMVHSELWASSDKPDIARRFLAHHYNGHNSATIWPVSACPHAEADENFLSEHDTEAKRAVLAATEHLVACREREENELHSWVRTRGSMQDDGRIFLEAKQVSRLLKKLLRARYEAQFNVWTKPSPDGATIQVSDTGRGLEPEGCAEFVAPYVQPADPETICALDPVGAMQRIESIDKTPDGWLPIVLGNSAITYKPHSREYGREPERHPVTMRPAAQRVQFQQIEADPFAVLEQLKRSGRVRMELKDFDKPAAFATPGVGRIPASFLVQRRLWFSTDQGALLRQFLRHHAGGHPISQLWPNSDCPQADDCA